jgi:GT2 family glycosyltransferase
VESGKVTSSLAGYFRRPEIALQSGLKSFCKAHSTGMNSSFSVVTPSYNQGQFIRATIESVLSQRIPSLQYLVMDGGSKDGTVEILKEYGDRLSFVSEHDEGTGDAVNKGLALCQAEIIGWLNSDDVYYPQTLSRVVELFELHPEVDVIYGRAHHIDEHGAIIEEYPTEEWSFEGLIRHCIISQPAAFFRRRVIEKFGPLAIAHKYCVDYEFWIRLAKKGARFLFVPELFAATRLHDQAKTCAARKKCHKDTNDILVEHLGYLPPRWISNYAHIKAEEFIRRSKSEATFFFWLVVHYLLTDLRWNKRISHSTIELFPEWIAGWLYRVRTGKGA